MGFPLPKYWLITLMQVQQRSEGGFPITTLYQFFPNSVCLCMCSKLIIMDFVTAKEVTHEPIILRYHLKPFLQMGIVLAALQASGWAALCEGGYHAFASSFADSHLRECYPVLVFYYHYQFGPIFLVYWSWFTLKDVRDVGIFPRSSSEETSARNSLSVFAYPWVLLLFFLHQAVLFRDGLV